jgi:carbon storage regulator CsrA
MLVLTRKSRESVVVGRADLLKQLLRVTVLDIRGGKVTLGFEADRAVSVHRLEVWNRIGALASPGSPTRKPIVPAA